MTLRRLASTLAVALSAVVAATAPAVAAVFIPTKTADTADGACDADCSLREAVIEANGRAGDDVILLHAGTYQLAIAGSDDTAAGGDFDVLDDLVVIGDGAGRVIVDGAVLDRLFHVAAGAALEIRDVTLRNGRASGGGGAILNSGALTILRSVLADSVAAGGSNGLGGAIFTTGGSSTLELRDSTVTGNVAEGRGGGIAVAGETTLANVTLAGNSAAGSGGGLYVFTNTTLTVNNATISGNSSLNGGGAFIEISAFTGLAPRITNSILAGNSAPAGPDCVGGVDSGYDLIGNGAGCVGPSTATHDLVGTAGAPIDARLDALQSLGGPTPVLPLHIGSSGLDTSSPALDAGSPAAPGSGAGACEATDQRGADRPGAGRPPRCDIGAYENTTQCVAGGPYLCLAGERFSVTAFWERPGGGSGLAQAVQLTADSGYFWFFGPDNVEVTVKLLNACVVNNRYWVFASGMTNVRVVLSVVDTQSHTGKSYTNPQGRVFRSILDTNAFATCP